MRSRQQRKKFLAAWLGLCGLAVQALLPLLLAVEIAAQPFDPAAEALCLHSPADAPPAQPQQDHFTGCAICLSLAASVAFTAPPPLELPLPDLVSADVYALDHGGTRTQFFHASYQSRAPPQLG
jgi:hypothetical protein